MIRPFWDILGRIPLLCNWQPVLGMCALGDRSVPVAPSSEGDLTSVLLGWPRLRWLLLVSS